MMDFFVWETEAQLNREIYVAMLRGLARKVGGEARLAQRIGMQLPQLSAYLNPSGYLPRPQTAERIAAAVPMDPEERQLLEERMKLASARRLESRDRLKEALNELPVARLLKEIKSGYCEAASIQDPQGARLRLRASRELGKSVAEKIGPRAPRLDVVELYGLLQDMESILNHPLASADYALRARRIMLSLDRCDYSYDIQRYDHLLVNSCRIVAVAFHNLELFYDAGASIGLAESKIANAVQRDYWIPHLHRDWIYATSGQPRFLIYRVKDLWKEIEQTYRRTHGDSRPPEFIHTARAIGSAYMQSGNLRKAKEVMFPQLEILQKSPEFSFLDRAMFLKSYARLRMLAGDKPEWRYFITEALRIDLERGFAHQVSEIQQEYGAEVAPILTELSSL